MTAEQGSAERRLRTKYGETCFPTCVATIAELFRFEARVDVSGDRMFENPVVCAALVKYLVDACQIVVTVAGRRTLGLLEEEAARVWSGKSDQEDYDTACCDFVRCADHLGMHGLIARLNREWRTFMMQAESPNDIVSRFRVAHSEQFVLSDTEALKTGQLWDSARQPPLTLGTSEDEHVDPKWCISKIVDNGDQASFVDNPVLLLYSKIKPRRRPMMLHDDAVQECMGCSYAFTTTFRRHHCRVCGGIFCHTCGPLRMGLSADEISAATSSSPWTSSLEQPSASGVRMCDGCHAQVRREAVLLRHAQAFSAMGLDLCVLQRIAAVCKRWFDAAVLSLSWFREIQYAPATRPLTIQEKRMLWHNRAYIAGHDRWMLQLSKSLNWEDATAVAKWKQLFDPAMTKTCPCWFNMCSRQCRQVPWPDPASAFELITQGGHPLSHDFALECVARSESWEELTCYAPAMVHHLPACAGLGLLLMKKAAEADATIEFVTTLYWLLRAEGCLDRTLDIWRCKLLLAVPEHTSNMLMAQERLVQCIELCISEGQASQLPDSLNALIESGVQLMSPSHPGVYIDRIEPGVEQKSSATAPLVVRFVSTTDRAHALLYKREDVRKELIVMSVIRRMHLWLAQGGIEAPMLTYRIMPLSLTNGIVEMVSNAKTLAKISDEDPGDVSIIRYLQQHNQSRTVQDIQQTFARSAAAYTVATYLLAVGDRHLDNIMLASDGRLFHIDYGYVLGQEPRPSAVWMKLNKCMTEALWDPSHRSLDGFKAMCADVFRCLRRYDAPVMNMLMPLAFLRGQGPFGGLAPGNLSLRASAPVSLASSSNGNGSGTSTSTSTSATGTLARKSGGGLGSSGSNGGGVGGQRAPITVEEIQARVVERFLPGPEDDASAVLFHRLDHSSTQSYSQMAWDFLHAQNVGRDTLLTTPKTLERSVGVVVGALRSAWSGLARSVTGTQPVVVATSPAPAAHK